MPKNSSFGIFFIFDLLSLFFPSFLLTTSTFDQKKKDQNDISLPWSPDICNENMFNLSHYKTYHTVTMDFVGLKIGLMGTSSSTITFIFLS